MSQLMSRHRSRQARAAIAAALALALGALGACSSGDDPGSDTPSGDAATYGHFGLEPGSSVDLVIFDGGYGTEYAQYAADLVAAKYPDVTLVVTPSTSLAQEVQPRFVGGNPPDILVNDGDGRIPPDSLSGLLLPLDDFWNAENYDGVKLSEAVSPAAKQNDVDGVFTALGLPNTVMCFWYSASLFEANGWEPPQTWDDLIALNTEAKAAGVHLFTFGKEAATYYEWLALDSVIKEAGEQPVIDMVNYVPGAWQSETVVEVFTKLKELIDAEAFIPGGSGTQFTQAQSQWSLDQAALLYPSGSWIANEMKDATAPGFEMTASPFPTLTSGSKFPFTAVATGSGTSFAIPKDAANVAGAKEFLAALFSKEAAGNFSKLTGSPNTVLDSVPADGFGDSALGATMKIITESGDDSFASFPLTGNWNRYDNVGVNHDVEFIEFLSGNLTVVDYLAAVQAKYDKAAAEHDITVLTTL